MTRHLTTDPACIRHRRPRTWLGHARYNRNRGRSCGTCVAARVTMRRRVPAPGYRVLLTVDGVALTVDQANRVRAWLKSCPLDDGHAHVDVQWLGA